MAWPLLALHTKRMFHFQTILSAFRTWNHKCSICATCGGLVLDVEFGELCVSAWYLHVLWIIFVVWLECRFLDTVVDG